MQFNFGVAILSSSLSIFGALAIVVHYLGSGAAYGGGGGSSLDSSPSSHGSRSDSRLNGNNDSPLLSPAASTTETSTAAGKVIYRKLLFYLSLADFGTAIVYLGNCLFTPSDIGCSTIAVLGIYFPVASFLLTDCIAYVTLKLSFGAKLPVLSRMLYISRCSHPWFRLSSF